MAEGILVHRLRQFGQHRHFKVSSAGTHASPAGQSADKRALNIMAEHGIPPIKTRSRQMQVGDFQRFDYIIAMDCKNFENLKRLSPADCIDKLCLLSSFSPELVEREVRDPYFGSIEGFREVFRYIDHSISGLTTQLLDTRT